MTYPEVAIYRGDKFVTCGSIDQVADELGVKPNTIKFYLTPAYRRRLESRGSADTALIAIPLEEDEA